MNSELVDKIDSSDEWIRERSGIISRHFAADDESVIDMAEHASRQALENAGLTADQIGFGPRRHGDPPLPDAAAAPSSPPGSAPTAPALDISAACAGYCYGVTMASDMIKGGSADYVLVVGVEKLSDFTDPYDRGSAFIFGDGAGACVIGPSDTPGIGPTVWGSDGLQRDAISQRQAWTDVRESWKDAQADKAVWPAIGMAGQSVFRWAVWGMAPVAQQAIDKAGIKADDLDAFIPHQANIRIIDAMVKQLKLPADIPVARDIVDDGQHLRGLDPARHDADARARARCRAAASRCRSASAPGSCMPPRSSCCREPLTAGATRFPPVRRVIRTNGTDIRRHPPG